MVEKITFIQVSAYMATSRLTFLIIQQLEGRTNLRWSYRPKYVALVILLFSWSPKVHYQIHKSPTLVPTLFLNEV
jgi:hypothetical protein